MSPDELREAVAKIRWFHSIDLGSGIVTPGYDPSTAERAKGYGIPEDLRGKSVLDIGAWDGFFSFEAERRGASRVVAVDSYCWSGPGWGTKAGFEPALRVGARVTRHAQAAGLMLRTRGEVVTLAPPFVITEAEIDEMVAILRTAIEKTMGEIR